MDLAQFRRDCGDWTEIQAVQNHLEHPETAFFPTLSGVGIQAAGGLTARLSDSIYVYAEYHYANNNRVRISWAVDAGLRWVW